MCVDMGCHVCWAPSPVRSLSFVRWFLQDFRARSRIEPTYYIYLGTMFLLPYMYVGTKVVVRYYMSR